ncbi:unnamed protein product [Kuraishia capsulata CBS 1993]|uniref:Actin-related protein 2/3 complex subunit n=1 Tax=Kuraishia capsulata CBS 1993 TaxID=1382522 RepID=W6MKG6_9ASCO|nr:uncharacterized protein KUCA_T00002971001 [Kuraishia capsulata CBS 1993]CDK26994.1 unnamed protein product [Kuraishia capsulata CBS 1993]
MSPVQYNLITAPIYDHFFTQNGKLLAITNGNNVELYDVSGPKPKKLTVLQHHDKPITAIDISADGKIVTCSQDRNALVWEPLPSGEYKPTLVLLRINRAATCVKWSPNGLKFAVGSGARAIAICYFEEENDWWISKHIKKPIRSTILSVDWHPNSVLLAAGSADGHVRVFSTFVKSVDAKPAPSVWGERLPFQTLCGDYLTASGGSWIHDVAFSPSGDSVAFVGHDSTFGVVSPSDDPQVPGEFSSVPTNFLPFKSILFANEHKVIAAGHDCHPVVFEQTGSGWAQTAAIDDPKTAKRNEVHQQSALNMFRQMDLKGGSPAEGSSSTLLTIHQNTINKLRPYAGTGNVTRFSSSGNDGKVVIFDV